MTCLWVARRPTSGHSNLGNDSTQTADVGLSSANSKVWTVSASQLQAAAMMSGASRV